MNIQNTGHPSALEIQNLYLNRNLTETKSADSSFGSFEDILKQRAEELTGNSIKFSRHAENRLLNRNINLTNEQMTRLREGCEKAGAKGIQESLVVLDSLAFIVNVPNKTVITAMDRNEAQDNIFTNIDGAVFI